jgi:electron transfer flavoprotein alpha subunit
MSVMIFSEKDDVAFELLAKAREVFSGTELSAVLLTVETSEKAQDYFAQGADIVHYAHGAELKGAHPELYANILHELIKNNNIDTMVMGSTHKGKQTASMLAQKLNCGCITDVIDLRMDGDALQADRYTLAGNTIATEVPTSSPRIIAVMPHAFKPNERRNAKGVIKEFTIPSTALRLKAIERREKKGEKVNLEDAKVIVGVGKGFKNQEDLELARGLASVLKAEIGCTRPLAVDFKWLSEDRSIGLSSKKVAPDLYFAIGISGQIQHTVGIMQSRTIVAINKSEDAVMFDASDYGIVGDLYKVLPKLTEEIKKVTGG